MGPSLMTIAKTQNLWQGFMFDPQVWTRWFLKGHLTVVMLFVASIALTKGWMELTPIYCTRSLPIVLATYWP